MMPHARFGRIPTSMLPGCRNLWSTLLALSLVSACQSAGPLTEAASTDGAALMPTQSIPLEDLGSAAALDEARAPSSAASPAPVELDSTPDSEFPLAVAAVGSDPEVLTLNPLTGLPPSSPSMLERRPLAIKISNYPRDIRPQFGLNEADVVFEYYIEWGYTRFIGIFYGNDASKIGPVRSGRYFDEHITRMYHAYYVFNFADPREYKYFMGGDLAKSLVVPGRQLLDSPVLHLQMERCDRRRASL